MPSPSLLPLYLHRHSPDRIAILLPRDTGNHAMLNSVSDLWAFPLNAPPVDVDSPYAGPSGWVQLSPNDAHAGPGPRQNPLFAAQGGGSCVIATGGQRQVRFPQEPELVYTDVWQWCA